MRCEHEHKGLIVRSTIWSVALLFGRSGGDIAAEFTVILAEIYNLAGRGHLAGPWGWVRACMPCVGVFTLRMLFLPFPFNRQGKKKTCVKTSTCDADVTLNSSHGRAISPNEIKNVALARTTQTRLKSETNTTGKA